MIKANTGVCALGQNHQKEGGHTCLVLTEVEKPHLPCKEKNIKRFGVHLIIN